MLEALNLPKSPLYSQMVKARAEAEKPKDPDVFKLPNEYINPRDLDIWGHSLVDLLKFTSSDISDTTK